MLNMSTKISKGMSLLVLVSLIGANAALAKGNYQYQPNYPQQQYQQNYYPQSRQTSGPFF
jgi:hypothetical protein